METVNIRLIARRLSKLQKTILRLIPKKRWGTPVGHLSWRVAWELDPHCERYIRSKEKRAFQLVERTRGWPRDARVAAMKLFLHLRQQKYWLSASFRASFSRSLKRLETRGLVGLKRTVGEPPVFRGRATRIWLTEEGGLLKQTLKER